MANNYDLFKFKLKEKKKSKTTEDEADKLGNSFSGEVMNVVYRNDDDTYSVIKIKTENNRIVTVVGSIPGAFQGQGVQVKGEWDVHGEFGRQFKVSKFKFTLPITATGIERYLSSGLIPGIGPKKAKQIVDHFKERTLDILDNYSSRLKEVPGFGKLTIDKIKTAWDQHSESREVFLYFQSLGITPAYCNKIIKRFGSKALEVVKNNPYELASEVFGIGFVRADKIAKDQGISHNDQKRIVAGISYALLQISQSGHMCYPAEEFLNYASDLLELEPVDIEKVLDVCLMKKSIVIEKLPLEDGGFKDFIYRSDLYKHEVKLAELISKLVNSDICSAKKMSKITSINKGIKLNSEQTRAVNNVSECNFSVITGGPGVGKTTVVGEIVRKAKLAGLKIYLAAPTGKAAKRLSETTNLTAMTIHRLLKWDPAQHSFVFNQDNLLNCNLLIIDETSMIDITLACHLFAAVSASTTVVLVGDVDQLPSVGPGKFLNDIIESGICPVTILKRIYRQANSGNIIPNAHAVNEGKMINTNTGKDSSKLEDFYFIEQDDQEKASDTIVKMVTERIPARFGFNPIKDIQVLTPMSKGLCGTKALNEKLQKAIHPSNNIPRFEYGFNSYKAGDKVMQIVNNYDKNVFNGDAGTISFIDSKNKIFNIQFDDKIVEYKFSEADQITLSYAVTIHKSQGSEFPAIIIPCLTAHFVMLQRNLLYTGITRAKKLLIVIGSKKALRIAIGNFRYDPRFSGFLERLKVKSKKDIRF